MKNAEGWLPKGRRKELKRQMEGVLFHRLGALKERAVAAIALVEIDLADDLIRRVHAQHRNTGVDHVHAVLGAQVGDLSLIHI